MKKFLTFCILSTLFFSCKKEISNEDPNAFPPIGGGGGTTSAKLITLGEKSGSDSVAMNFTYTTANRIASIALVGTVNGGQPVNRKLTYERNASNIIIKETYEDPELAQYGLTQIVTNHNYDAPTSKYNYSLTVINILTFSLRDSSAYTYDASGKLISLINYVNDGSGYEPTYKEEYTYSGTNVASLKVFLYDDQTSTYELDETQTYEYDTKVNPVLFTTDAVALKTLLGYAFFYSANNIIKTTSVVVNPPSTDVSNVIYTYGSNNRPATAVLTSASFSSQYTYHYQ